MHPSLFNKHDSLSLSLELKMLKIGFRVNKHNAVLLLFPSLGQINKDIKCRSWLLTFNFNT